MLWQFSSFCLDLASNWLLKETLAERLHDIKTNYMFSENQNPKIHFKKSRINFEKLFYLLVPSISIPSQLLKVVIYYIIVILLLLILTQLGGTL